MKKHKSTHIAIWVEYKGDVLHFAIGKSAANGFISLSPLGCEGVYAPLLELYAHSLHSSASFLDIFHCDSNVPESLWLLVATVIAAEISVGLGAVLDFDTISFQIHTAKHDDDIHCGSAREHPLLKSASCSAPQVRDFRL